MPRRKSRSPDKALSLIRRKRKKMRRLKREREEPVASFPGPGRRLEEPVTSEVGMDEWVELGIPTPLIKGLYDQGFKVPTPIQREAIPVTIKTGKDIIGAAETGSGKTLAFGIPILCHILLNQSGEVEGEGGEVKGEGGEEVEGEGEEDEDEVEGEGEDEVEGEGDYEEGMQEVKAKRLKIDKDLDSSEKLGLIAMIDNIPDEEFERMLSEKKRPLLRSDPIKKLRPLGPTALILVPVRELALQIYSALKTVAKYTTIKICPIVGGMAKSKQERLLSYRPSIVIGTVGRVWNLMSEGDPHLCCYDNLRYLVLDEADRMVELAHYQDLWNIMDRLNGAKGAPSRRNLVYSATLTLSRRITEQKKKKKSISRQEVMDKLMREIGLKENAAIIDLTKTKVVVESLTETKIMCTTEDKDVYLYYFLLRHPGRTLIFVNTIRCLQRLRSILELLQIKPLPLHANMQQRQRLKNLDRFNSSPTGLLIASDVAARGLDFPKVEHVIHYQVPMNTEVYVHRSGRTARGCNEGISMILVAPEDLKAYQNIRRTLNKDQNLKDFPVEVAYLKPLRARVSLACRIQKISFRQGKTSQKKSWFSRTAKALDVELDEDLLEESDSRRDREDNLQLSRLKCELTSLLASKVRSAKIVI